MEFLSNRANLISQKEPSLLYRGFARCLADPYHPKTNRTGIINLGTSENLLNDDLIIPKLESFTTITPSELRYNNARGMEDLRVEVAKLLTDKTGSDVTVTSSDISMTNGCASGFCELAYLIGDPGDWYMTPSPYFNMIDVFMGHMELKPLEFNFTDIQEMVEVYDKARDEGKSVKGVVLINPHNPTGTIYSKELVLEVMEFAKERSLHVIIDEIYIFSVFDTDTFESCLSFTAQWPDPPRTHYLWSFSKDFSMSGSRCGVIYSQNPEVHAAIGRDIGFYHQIPGILQMKLTNMLRDREWVDMYLAESRRRLKHHARIVMSYLDDLGLSYIKPTGTLYIWVDFTLIFKADPSETEAEQIFMKMIEYKVYIPSAKGFNGTDPRYFRIVFSVPENYLREAMERLGEFVKKYIS